MTSWEGRAARRSVEGLIDPGDIARAMNEQFTKVDSMMFIRVKPTPPATAPEQGGEPTRADYEDDVR